MVSDPDGSETIDRLDLNKKQPDNAMTDYLLDTSVFLAFARADLFVSERLQRLLNGSDRGAYSTITEAELLSSALSSDERKALETLLSFMTRVPVSKRVAREAARLHREKEVTMPDAIISASALVIKRRLLTRDSTFARLDPSLVEIISP